MPAKIRRYHAAVSLHHARRRCPRHARKAPLINVLRHPHGGRGEKASDNKGGLLYEPISDVQIHTPLSVGSHAVVSVCVGKQDL